MHGKAYLEAFDDIELGAPTDPEQYVLADSHSAQLTNKLILLYGIGEIAFLGDEIEPQAVVEAVESVQDKRYLYEAGALAVRNVRRGHARLGERLVPDTLVFNKPPQEEESKPDLQQAAKSIENSCEELQLGLTMHSDLVLSHALLNLQRMVRGNRGELKDGQAPEAVRLAVTSQRRPMIEVIEPWRGIISFSRDMYKSKEIDFSADVQRIHKHVPAWLQSIDGWHQPLHRLSAAITEVEALIVAQEWALARGLPYVPVISPKHLEGGGLNGSKNPHADMLLCNVSPDSNEIIPVQIKNTLSPTIRQRYIDDMRFLTPQSLGFVRSHNQPVRLPDGIVRTGHRTTVELGHIIEGYYQCYGRRRIKPSRAEYQEFMQRMQPGFEYFDSLID